MPTFTDYSLDLAHYVRIETIGRPTATTGGTTETLYIFTRIPDNNWTASASQRFWNGLHLRGGFEQRADVLGGIAEVSGIKFEIQERPGLEWADLLATERWNTAPGNFPRTFMTGGGGGVGTPLDRDDVTLFVESTAGFPASGPLWIGAPGNQECLQYTGVTATSFIGLTRGRHPATGNSFARTHRVNRDADGNRLADILVTTRPTSFFGLRVAVYSIARDRDGVWEPEGSAVRRYTGFIRHVEYVPDRNGYRFSCDSLFQALDREVFTLDPIYRSRFVGIHLIGLANRRITIVHRRPDPEVEITITPDEWYESVDDLVLAINDAISADWSANARTVGDQPILRVYELRARWGLHRTSDSDIIDIYMGGATAGALGWHPVETALGLRPRLAVEDVGNLPASTESAPFAFPATYLSWPWDFTGDVTLRVDSAEGVTLAENPGGTQLASVLVGGHAGMRVSASDTVSDPNTLTVSPGFIGGLYDSFQPYYHSIALDANGEPTDSGVENEYTDAVEQVFVPPAPNGMLTIRRLLLSTGTSGFNADDFYVDGYGVGLDDDDVDRTGLIREGGRRLIPAGQRMWRSSEPIREFLEEYARVFGWTWVMRAGQLSIAQTIPFGLARASVSTIADGDLDDETQKPGYAIKPSLYFTGAEFSWDWDPAREEFARGPVPVRTGATQGGAENRLAKIESRSIYGPPSGVMADVMAMVLGWMTVFARPQPRVTIRLSARWWQRLVPMDVVTLNLSALHDIHAGGYGTTTTIGIVLAVREEFEGGAEVELILLNEQRQAPLAPSALLDHARGDGGLDQVSDPVNDRLYLRDNEFTDAPDLDINWFAANDRILVCQDNAADPTAPRLWRVTVASINIGGAGDRYLVLMGALPAPAFVATDHYFVTFDTHDVVPSSRYVDGTWIADDADSRIGATNDWYIHTE